MNLHDIDRELIHWRQKLRLAAENLDAVQRLPAFAQAARGDFSGLTADRVGSAAQMLNELRANLQAITEIIERAAALRAPLSWLMPSARVLRDIEALLEGPSIELPARETSPERRELLRPLQTAHAIAPGGLLQEMLAAFRHLRDATLEVDRAQSELHARLSVLEQDIATLSTLPVANKPPTGLAHNTETFAQLREIAAPDPLLALQKLAPLAAWVERSLRDHATAAAEETGLRNDLTAAKKLLDRLTEGQALAVCVYAEQQAKVQPVDAISGAPLNISHVDSIAAWLTRIEQTVATGDGPAARKGLTNWTRTVRDLVATEEMVIKTSMAALNARRDLAGLLDALLAKARSTGRSADKHLAEIAREAGELLRQHPTPMARAQALVTEYECRLLNA